MPDLMEVIVMKEGMELPVPDLPYYVLAKEDLFLMKKTQIGTVMVPEKKMPYTVGSIGEYKQGVFNWEGDPIPGHIVGQATAFFRRIYEKHKTEAEVLIVKHNETGAYRLFVPYQRTSPAGVKSVFEPTHVHKDYSIIGTLHSHCMMSAFHSGTDSNDASAMDGVHFTIGMVMNETPQIVAMVTMNKKEFHYSTPATIADIEFNDHPAPAWWDSYVYPAGTPAAKPASLKSITEAMWNEFKGIAKVNPVSNYPSAYRPHWSGGNEFGWRGHRPSEFNSRLPIPVIARVGSASSQMTNESAKFNAKQEKRRRKEERQRARGRTFDTKMDARDRLDDMFASDDPQQALDWMTISLALDAAEDTGVFHDEDWRDFKATELDSITHWQLFFARRMADLADVLDTLGMNVEFNVRAKQPKQPQLPGQTAMDDYIGGAL